MKPVLFLIVSVLLLAVGGSSFADEKEAKREAKPRFKGVEIYSWKDAAGDWFFALMDGTNRDKSEAEIKRAKVQVKGVEALKKALALLAEGESVSWVHRDKAFTYPPEATRKDIAKAAKDAKIELFIAAD